MAKMKKQKRASKKTPQKTVLLFALSFALLGVTLFGSVLMALSGDQATQAQAASTPDERFGIAAGDILPYLSPTELNAYLDDYKALGSAWVRFDFDWVVIQEGGPTSYDWAKFDNVVNAANARGIKVLGTIDFTPTWALPAGCTDPYFCPPKSNADYATFAAAVVERYAPMGVHHWEIWNEPNLSNRFTIANYTNLLKAAYPAIKNVDPTAVVMTGGTAPAATEGGDTAPIAWLSGIYQNGGKAYFDAVAHHPYCYDAIPGGFSCPTVPAETWSGWSQMQDTNPSLRSVMTANSDQAKKIWGTEFGGPTGGGSIAITEAQQAQMMTDAYTRYNSYSWSGPLFWYSYKDRSTAVDGVTPCTTVTDVECFFGIVRNDGTHKPAYDVYKNLATTTTATPTATPTNTVVPTKTPTTIPTNVPTPTPTQAGATTVKSLSVQVGTSWKNTIVSYTLQSAGSKTVDLVIAVRKNGVNYDFPVIPNVTLTGTQSFTSKRILPKGTYTYWVAYYYNGQWVDLSPQKSFKVSR